MRGTVCACGAKHYEDSCPACGLYVNRVKKKYHMPPRKAGKTNMANLFRKYVEHRYPNYFGQAVRCDNCGKLILTLKFENISHKKSKGSAPQLAEEFDNLEILCGPTDFWGRVDLSCHTLWERKRFDEFHKLKGQRS